MLSNNLQRKIKGLGFVFSLFFGVMLVSVVSAQAQYYPNQQQDRQNDRRDRDRDRRDDDRRNDNYGNNGGYGNNNFGAARQEGFRDGLSAGSDDARNRKRFDPQKHSDYKKATDGYNNRYGNKNQYKQAYRDAFMQGYQQGFSRNDNNRYGNGRRGY